eukprot:CAMPEP_0113566046 /NCGR_PEP_ID=MMETSP0015_2-20120614/22509_1 /TAXON_ID=2838 /ORGANISM="Odontella" /LENGTH=439 /DNA_ID=CAMNT_0000468299 /DNA_START=154 /DNA_END=1469 /DNA_ORIENTATION=- /assembly_acc=CAM_ASM_000160
MKSSAWAHSARAVRRASAARRRGDDARTIYPSSATIVVLSAFAAASAVVVGSSSSSSSSSSKRTDADDHHYSEISFAERSASASASALRGVSLRSKCVCESLDAQTDDRHNRIRQRPEGRQRRSSFGPDFLADAAAVALPSVVQIRISVDQDRRSGGCGESGRQWDCGTGSGFLVDASVLLRIDNGDGADGDEEEAPAPPRPPVIVTNAHVVLNPDEFGRDEDVKGRMVRILTHGGYRASGRVVATDADADLAIVELVDDDEGEGFSGAEEEAVPVRIGSSAALRHGQFVVALGSPLSLRGSVSAGIVSNPKRYACEFDDDEGGGNENDDAGRTRSRTRTSFIQTDAPINVGNSGGPLIDMNGRVIGINTLSHPRGEGVSFSVPIDEAIAVLRQLYDKGRADRLELGFDLKMMNAGPEEERNRARRFRPSSSVSDDEGP